MTRDPLPLLEVVASAPALPDSDDRLRYVQDDLQPHNGLEAVLIERLAGDLWKADRAEGLAGARTSFRLRHGPVDQALKEMDEAIELGQHLLWQPAFPLPVGLNEGEVSSLSQSRSLAGRQLSTRR
jgi:hypothetical protein